ncbi:MAG: MFS transporter [Flavobacteriia bacterium]|nr:MFS transporter [Flavobacteriia bacterium]OJX39124.1 MAG: MFS transporter [Flavobacteriia bacterium 40-80]
MTFTTKEKISYLFSVPVIVAALGYFVDIYDLLLFSIVRIPSLRSMGLDVDTYGTMILNWEKTGLLLGGILWGMLGDKKGRLSVLFGSILVYSLANVCCGLLPHVEFMEKQNAYALFRFIAGLGLAGELGAGITLVSESLPKELRAIGTSIVAGFGLFGAVVASLTVELAGDWTVSYFIGGGLGLLLLILRISVVESGIYKNIAKNEQVAKGNFLSFFTNYNRFVRYMKCIAIGLPTWFCIGILAVFANQIGAALGIREEIDPGKAILWAYVGISAGDLASGFISNKLKSRKRAIFYMMLFTIIGVVLMLSGTVKTVEMYYVFCVWLGLGTGYWALFVTVGAEQFGTNIRATAATTIPNMVRGTLVIMILIFNYFKPSYGVIWAAVIVGILAFGLGIYSTLTIPETHDKDLDFTE